MSILNNGIRAWWIQKSESCNIANKAEFCDFKPTIHDKGYEWVRVISLDDFHAQTNINITRWIEVCQEIQKLKEENEKLKEFLELCEMNLGNEEKHYLKELHKKAEELLKNK